MNPYDEIDRALIWYKSGRLSQSELQDRLYEILEVTIENVKNGDFEDEED